MKNYIKVLFAVMVVSLFFSLFSGCKLKQKVQQKEEEKTESTTKSTEQVTVKKTDSLATVKTDQSKVKTEETEKTSNTRTIELTIDLDSNKVFPVDSSGNLSLNALVNSALKNARRIQIKATEQQSQESNKKHSADLDKKEQLTKVGKSAVDSSKTFDEKVKKEVEKGKTETVKDSTVKQNVPGYILSWLGWISLFILVIAIIYWLEFRK